VRLLFVLRMAASAAIAMFLWSRTRLVARLLIITAFLRLRSTRLLILGLPWLLLEAALLGLMLRFTGLLLEAALLGLMLRFTGLLLEAALLGLMLRLTGLLFESTLLCLILRLPLLFEPMLLRLLELRTLLLMVLELRPVLVASIVVERVLLRVSVEAHRTLGSHILRMSAVVLRVEAPVGASRFHVLHLNRGRSHVMLVHRHALFGTRIVTDAARAAVVRDVVIVDDCRVIDDRPIHVRIVDDGSIHVHDRGVIGKIAAMPLSAHEANAHVAESIVHATVEANVRSPVSGMEDVQATGPAPVRWSPQCALVWRRNPRTGNPVVAIIPVSPVAGRPHPAGLRAGRLNVDGQHRRRNAHADQYARKGRCGNDCTI